jgi:DNA-binding transcriptional regulator YhcF (GntR family)
MEFTNNKAIYLQLVDVVFRGILDGTWKEEERIPSVRDFAAEFEVNPNTVVKAFETLQQYGIIEQQRGLGYFLVSGAKKTTKELIKQEFVQNELPHVFSKMNMLEFTIGDFEKAYQKYCQKIK